MTTATTLSVKIDGDDGQKYSPHLEDLEDFEQNVRRDVSLNFPFRQHPMWLAELYSFLKFRNY
jgi:hypothetical protein